MSVTTLSFARLRHCIPARKKDTHKYDYGHVLIIGGAPGMSGAVRMAGEAALRVGAGIVSIATHPAHANSLNLTRPELIARGIENIDGLLPLLEKASVVALGPGLGQTPWSQQLFKRVLDTPKPLIVDADALNLLARQPRMKENWILTPHLGEALRLLEGVDGVALGERMQMIKFLQKRYDGIIVLKGCGTLLTDGKQTFRCQQGNPGMASAGMGDVLTGVIAGLLAQGLDNVLASKLGVALHARAGDLAAKAGMRGLLAMDLMPYLRKLMQ